MVGTVDAELRKEIANLAIIFQNQINTVRNLIEQLKKSIIEIIITC